MAFRVSKEAERDLDGIFLYWAKRTGLNVADRIIDNITDRFRLVGEHPEAGKASEEIAHRVRCFPAGKYLIYYRRIRASTEILHIFHGARDQQRAFKKGKRR
jgi:toxin ParE1/3/4